MQTFVPYPCLRRCFAVLDDKRLGKQRVEALQIEEAIRYGTGWANHSACLLWEDYLPFLAQYRRASIQEWCRRGFKNNIPIPRSNTRAKVPRWWGTRIHLTHRRALLAKNPDHYSRFFNCEPRIDYDWYYLTGENL